MSSGGPSWLFVPGDRRDRFEKAVASGAHQVILDLEDAVAIGDKVAARIAVAEWLTTQGSAWVRINATDTRWHEEDVAALAGLPGVLGFVVPKSESADELTSLSQRVGTSTPLLALVESALGIANAIELARTSGVCGLAFGSIDFLLDIDAEEGDDSLAFARGALVVAARASGLPGPIDGVCTATNDIALVSAEAARARRMGYAGKLCIHPIQVEPVNTAFVPTQRELAWAATVVSSMSSPTSGSASAGVLEVGGHMIDRPVVERARRLLAKAGITVPSTSAGPS